MNYVTGKFGDIGEMACLSGGPRRRGTEKGVGKGFMIGEQCEFSSFKEKTEIADRGIGSCEFTYRRRSTWIWWMIISWKRKLKGKRNHGDVAVELHQRGNQKRLQPRTQLHQEQGE